MTGAWIVECWRHSVCKKRRKFRTAEAAMDFANDWRDDHEERWDVQIISPAGRLYTVGINGNDSAQWLK